MSLLPYDENITKLYKYYKINDYFYDALENKYLYFNYPDVYNDPFDCFVSSIFEGTETDFKNWFEINGFPSDKYESLLNEFKINSAKYNKFNKQNFRSVLICCLSEKNDNILMWGHYADSHKGICLEYNTKIEGNSLGLLFDNNFILPYISINSGFLPSIKIQYSNNLPEKFNILKDDQSKLIPFLKTKFKDWEYEFERRIIIPPNISKSQKIYLNEKTLSGVIFGLNTDNKNIKKIFDIIKTNYILSDISFYKTLMCDIEYKVNIEKIANIEDYISHGR